MREKKKVLFICTRNSARSQMAEGTLRTLFGSRYEAFSAGTEPSRVNPYAVRVMAEIGMDISKQRSKSVEEFRGMEFDFVATVCDHARETCPYFPGAKHYLHHDFKDPSLVGGTESKRLDTFRQTREAIRVWIEKTFGAEIKNTVG